MTLLSPEGITLKFLVVLRVDKESGTWVAECPQLPGCFSQGSDRQAALDNIRAAIRLSFATRRQLELPPLELAEVEVKV
ncbi:MAG: type II toxin-antitoxin system HicB family antitoxin [Gemmataceae bacterium]|nr:type II toxin-antitoxin system HicB family antitoxin [Gemmataceae bacterium]